MAENPPAFPFSTTREIAPGVEAPVTFPGMTLRDWFASHAPACPNDFVIPGDPYPWGDGDPDQAQVNNWRVRREVSWARLYADAMLTERTRDRIGGGE